MTFWDFCAPLYDFFQGRNKSAYTQMLKTVRGVIPADSTVLEVATGTGEIGLAVANKVKTILCTDISEKMLRIARKKAKKQGISNARFGNLNIFDTRKPDNAFDVVIAGQVLHLIDEPHKAAAELMRITKDMVILPISFTKGLRGKAKLSVNLYRLFGFSPKVEFDLDSYVEFLPKIGFENCEIIQINGKIPMVVAIWRKGGELA